MMATGLVMMALVTHELGLAAYGRLALVTSVVALCGKFFDVRVGTVTTVFGAKRMRTDVASARGIFQYGYLVSAIAGVLSACVIAAIAVPVGPRLIGDDGTTLLLLYGLTLLTSTLQDPGNAMLRLLDRFRLVAAYTIATQLIGVVLIAVAVIVFQSLVAVVLALVIIDALLSVAEVCASAVAFRRASGGVRLIEPGMREVREERPAMLRMMWHTNIATYGSLAQTQLPPVVIGALGTPTAVGVYKIGMAFPTAMAALIDPLYGSVLPRLSRLWHAGRAAEVRHLIRDVSRVSIPLMTVLVLLLALPFRTPLLSALGGDEAIAAGAGTVLVLGLVARGFGSALFWNRPVLWAAGRSRTVARLTIGTTLLQITLLALLVPPHGAIGGAVALCVTTLTLNAIQTLLAFRAMSFGTPRLSEA